jgi:hypothetical protein
VGEVLQPYLVTQDALDAMMPTAWGMDKGMVGLIHGYIEMKEA